MQQGNRSFRRPARHLRRVLVGGNLSVLYSLRGTPPTWPPRAKILFLEDLDELSTTWTAWSRT